MGGVTGGLTIAVTGAGGLLGRHVVHTAMARGHDLRGLVRRGEAPEGAETHRGDLAEGGDWLNAALDGADVVIHAAASMSGDAEAHARDTLDATETLLEAMLRAGVSRLVHISSIAVYSVDPALEGMVIDEATPLETRPETRDAYAAAKLRQEAMVHAAAIPETWILRPGAIFGPGRTWNANLGPTLGPVLLRVGAGGEVPLISVESCASAVVLAAEQAPEGAAEALTLVDDDLPSRAECAAICRGAGAPSLVVPMPWPLWHALARTVNARGWLGAATARARLMPVRYANDRARARLGWTPANVRSGLAAAMAEQAP